MDKLKTIGKLLYGKAKPYWRYILVGAVSFFLGLIF